MTKTMKTIQIKGPVIDSGTGEFMKMFGADSYSYPSKLKSDLSDANGADIILEINSPGGITSAASEMYTDLKDYSGNVEVHVVGEADSAGSLIAMAGDKVLMSPTSLMMIHRAATSADGNTDDMTSTKQALDEIDQNIVNAYATKTGKNKRDIYDLMSKTTWMNAETAVKEGFADGLMEFDKDKQDKVAAPMLNSAIPVPHLDMKMVDEFEKFIKQERQKPKPEEKENKKISNSELVNHKLAILFGGK